MFEVEKLFSFEAGHTLHHHDGKCAKPHGHSYTLKVAVRSPDLIAKGPKTGMAVDFGQISDVVRPMLTTYFDHHWLNDTLHTDSPTAESIAKWIFDFLEPKLPGLYRVTIGETATSLASFTRE
jgi:6-pyruvoyltetrahydropterin/6-carboxytetrahydropterin synthase